jgi:hypothetical protein
VTALKLTRSPSGRVATAQVVTAAGATTVTGSALRSAAGIRSTWITSLASLSLTRPGGAVIYGRTLALTGKARNVKGAVIERRLDGEWKPVSAPGIAPAAKVKLLAPASFRITAGKLLGPVLKVPVAPVVTARVDGDRTVTGSVKPLEPGTTVELQVDSERGWSTTAQTTTGPDGGYTLAVPEPGRYRARVAPVQGFAEGLSVQIDFT